ncbi:MAG: hypothetical protein ACK496_09140 [Acidobacteriota bacterium]
MSNRCVKIAAVIIFLTAFSGELQAHPGGHGARSLSTLQVWTDRYTGAEVHGSLLYVEPDQVFIERNDGGVIALKLDRLSDEARQRAKSHYQETLQINHRANLADLVDAQASRYRADWPFRDRFRRRL